MSVSSDDSRFIINVQIEDTNGDVANDIARVWGDLLILRQNDINAALRKEDRIFIEFIDDPVYGLDRPRVKINTAAGAVFGALLGVVVVFLLEWLESGVVRRSQDVEKYLDIPVIGSIPGNN
jgi:capsular polysaccharide biosynthesis protein